MGFADGRTPPDFMPGQLLGMVSSHLSAAVPGLVSGNTTLTNQNLVIAREQLENYPIDLGLYNFNQRGVYSEPEFVWSTAVGPTAIQFYNSSLLGQEYFNHMFVGEYLGEGRILNFALNTNRTALDLPNSLSDKVANTQDETNPVVLGKGFGQVTDIEVSPEGDLYTTDWSSGQSVQDNP